MTTSRDLFLSLLATDAYNRAHSEGLDILDGDEVIAGSRPAGRS